MRVKDNMALLGILAVLLVVIIAITGFPLSGDRSQEVKVSKEQPPTFVDANNLEIIWDVSGSMWGEVAKDRKYLRSKKALKNIINSVPDNVNIGLRIFGNNKSQNGVTRLIVSGTKDNRIRLLEKIKNLTPAGKSPIGKALMEVSEDFKNSRGNKHILLVTDGIDTGNIMPEKVVNKLHKQGIKVHVLHVGSQKEQVNMKLKSIAQLGGGKYFTYSERNKVVPTMNLVE